MNGITLLFLEFLPRLDWQYGLLMSSFATCQITKTPKTIGTNSKKVIFLISLFNSSGQHTEDQELLKITPHPTDSELSE